MLMSLTYNYDIRKEHLDLAIKGLRTNDCTVPIVLWPVESNYRKPKDPWDIWEAVTYRRKMKDINIYWNRCLSAARKIDKQNAKRELLSKRRVVTCRTD